MRRAHRNSLGSSLKRRSTPSPESESDRSPKRLTVVHPSISMNSSEPQSLPVSTIIPNSSFSRLEDGIIASITDPGIRSTLQFWFTSGIINPHQIVKMAIECSSEIRNIIADMIPKECSEHMEEIEMTSSNAMVLFSDQMMMDEKKNEEFPGNENLFMNTNIDSTFTLPVEDDLDDIISIMSDAVEAQDEVEELTRRMYFPFYLI